MDTLITEVKSRLIAWADWSADSTNLGYPKTSIEYRIMREGPGAGIRSGRCGMPDIPECVAETDRALLRMEDEYLAAVKLKYLKPHFTDRDRARAMRISVDKYRRMLEQVYAYLAGALH